MGSVQLITDLCYYISNVTQEEFKKDMFPDCKDNYYVHKQCELMRNDFDTFWLRLADIDRQALIKAVQNRYSHDSQ